MIAVPRAVRRFGGRRLLSLLACAWLATAGAAAADEVVSLELLLAVDASGSVDNDEFALQSRGLAMAFRDPLLHAAIEGHGGAGIAVAVMQWSSPGHQLVAVDWTEVRDAASAAAFAERIEAAGRLLHGETAVAHALRVAAGLFADNGFRGRRRVIDLSGDGPDNFGGRTRHWRDRAVAAGITVNALAITNEYPELDLYYRTEVIGGPGAFVATATDYGDFAAAIRSKLWREIAPPLALGPRRLDRHAGPVAIPARPESL